MVSKSPRRAWWVCVLLAAVSAGAGAPLGSEPEPRVTVTIGEPSVWSLEQAHYLLSRMHERNRALNAKAPGDLDLNEIHGTRIELLRQMLGIGVEVDTAVRLQNEMAVRQYTTNLRRKEGLEAQLDQLKSERLELARGVAQTKLELEKEKLKPGGGDATVIQLLTAELDSKIVEAAALDAQISFLEEERGKLGAGKLELEKISPTAGTQLTEPVAKGLLEKAIQGTPSGVGSAKLHASTILDNYIQMQYEIIARQLTLLRDEVGPGNRLVFLELPYSFYTVPGRADDRLIQVWWRVQNYCETPEPSTEQAGAKGVSFLEGGTTQRTLRTAQKVREDCAKAEKLKELASPVGLLRAVDLIPRQSALNVNDIHSIVKGWRILGKFVDYLGFGGAVDFQRQRETYDQFIHQDVFASGFGKGEATFGWTFGPLPGTKRVAPGVRTTYAVLAIPEGADAVQLEGVACYYRRQKGVVQGFPTTEKPSDGVTCGGRKNFMVVLPEVNEGFFITDVKYTPVKPGQPVTVLLEGTYFSPQVGVLVEGKPLERVVQIAEFEGGGSVEKNPPGSTAPIGKYEMVNPRLLAMTFSMGTDYEGTPTISLVTPQKASPINYFSDVKVNGVPVSLREYSRNRPMFVTPLSVDGFRVRVEPDSLTGLISGKGFSDKAMIYINGHEIPYVRKASGHVEFTVGLDPVQVPFLRDGTWEIAVEQWMGQHRAIATRSETNPVAPRVESHQMFQSKGPVHVILKGSGLYKELQVKILRDAKWEDVKADAVTYLSPNELDIRIDGKPAPILLRLSRLSEQLSTTVDLRKKPQAKQ